MRVIQSLLSSAAIQPPESRTASHASRFSDQRGAQEKCHTRRCDKIRFHIFSRNDFFVDNSRSSTTRVILRSAAYPRVILRSAAYPRVILRSAAYPRVILRSAAYPRVILRSAATKGSLSIHGSFNCLE